jgi:putative flippase GtrA
MNALIRIKLFEFVRENQRSIVAFLSVGAFSAFVNFSVFTLCWKIFNFPYQYAVSIAYVLSVICHFTGNRQITFKSQGTGIFFQVIKYLTMVLTNYLITVTVVHFVVENLHFSPYIGIICAIATTVWTGFFMSKLWVFRRVSTVQS